MEERYARNRIYLSEDEQSKLKKIRLLLGGAGIGSVVAECALRLGIENITIVDGDVVEISNLNRQNYTGEDLGKFKAESLYERLKLINPSACLHFVNEYISRDNVNQIVENHDIAINALDFKSDIPFVFDECCRQHKIPVLHPYNLGWGGFVTVVKPDTPPLSSLTKGDFTDFELKMADYVCGYSAFWNIPENRWINRIVEAYRTEQETLSPPQLSIGSWLAAGICTKVIVDLALGREVKTYPKFYLYSPLSDRT
jgi:molybdopterin/thiamine biosynthesis adenylyltransferase